MTQPDPTQTTPAEVDLAAAGVAGWYQVLQDVATRRAELDEVEKTAKEKIQTALGDAVDGVIDGRPVVRWLHTAAPRRLDKKALTKDHPDIVAKYTVVGKPGRRFELVTPKDDA
ncbi:hypothetical protein [Actinomadura miaoliensis]|uniref:Uncharacterized protein n=1 Tax=Actinomadura miaoliensis TaxID=430685 RepID=A0ABP7V4X7_9ACTN